MNVFEDSPVKARVREWMFDLARENTDISVIFTLPAEKAGCARLFKKHLPDSVIYGAEIDPKVSKSDYTGIMYRDRVDNCSVLQYIARHKKEKRKEIDFINLDYCGGMDRQAIQVAGRLKSIASPRAVTAITHTVLLDGKPTMALDTAMREGARLGLSLEERSGRSITDLYCRIYEQIMDATLLEVIIYQNPDSLATMMCGVFQRNENER